MAAMTSKRERFVQEYLVDGNAKQAAIRAGYSAKSAEVEGCRLLRDAKVAAAIAAGQAKAADQLSFTKAQVIEELRRIGFADIRKAVKWGPKQHLREMVDGTIVVSSGVTLIDSSEIDDATAAAISEISNTRDGVKIKLHDKKGCLLELKRMFDEAEGAPPSGAEIEPPAEAHSGSNVVHFSQALKRFESRD
ncbi:phage terminase small subunit [Aminobacter lissarensis]|uniref:Phage terminase small subunit n=1 Tax=Aminobacter carboxidus TaxID=376165 RepID=A0A8E2BB95_9HYPH|nr:terminase small subunit [Aminobacter lissarensis]MBB6465593.1 phage terminase small subunit [Aminobacter lissarensis]